MTFTLSGKCWYGIPSHTVPLRALVVSNSICCSDVDCLWCVCCRSEDGSGDVADVDATESSTSVRQSASVEQQRKRQAVTANSDTEVTEWVSV